MWGYWWQAIAWPSFPSSCEIGRSGVIIEASSEMAKLLGAEYLGEIGTHGATLLVAVSILIISPEGAMWRWKRLVL